MCAHIYIHVNFAHCEGETEITYRPSKRQKGRHQINQLAYDVKVMEADFDNRQMTTFKSKAETQAKYGW